MVSSPVKAHGAWVRLHKKSGSSNNKESCPKLSNVRRNLFGFGGSEEKKTSAHENNKNLDQLLEEKFRERALKSSRVWNFDFQKEVPLPGRYEWQPVSCLDAPTFYSSVNRPASLKDSSNEKNINRNSDRACSDPVVKSKPVKQASKKPKLVQTSMKDFTRVQKRRTSCRLKLKHLQPYSFRLRNHHHLSYKTYC